MLSVLLRLFALLLLSVFMAATPAIAAAGPEGSTDNVRARLVIDQNVVTPGQTVRIGLFKDIRDGWHTYWVNPGSAGQATELDFDPEDVARAQPIIWPLPKSISIGDFVTNYGYEGELLLVREVTLPGDLVVGDNHTIRADAFWLVCEDICIPEDLSLELTVPVGEQARFDTDWGARIDREVAAAPAPRNWPASLTRIAADNRVQLTVTPEGFDASTIRNVDFFPISGAARKHADKADTRIGTEGVSITFTSGPGLRQELTTTEGLLRFEERGPRGWQAGGVLVTATPGEALAIGAVAGGSNGSTGDASTTSDMTLVTALIFAFIGGLILNLMPCVFPILFVKALSFTRVAHDNAGKIREHGLIFLAGVLISFAVFAAIIIAVQASGALVGWGFQLQSPIFVFALALLFMLIGLNLLGVFEIGTGLQNLGSGLAGQDGRLGAFFTGVLAVVVATPCTAPFMAGALGFTLGQPPLVVLAVFLALGLGLAFPFVLASFFPGLFKALPRPGDWMVRFRQVLAFPMFFTAIWLLWVYGRQQGVDAAMLALAALALISLGVFLWTISSGGRGPASWAGRITALVLVVVSLMGVIGAGRYLANTAPTDQVMAQTEVIEWTPEIVASLQAEGKSVFVDFTAAWCITCKFNERAVLATPTIQQAFAEKNVAFVVADWTARDDIIAAELRRHGRTGVPLYLVYAPQSGEPQILPQLLTNAIVLNALDRL
jgi:thiol:disulfide interchange protein DsbD